MPPRPTRLPRLRKVSAGIYVTPSRCYRIENLRVACENNELPDRWETYRQNPPHDRLIDQHAEYLDSHATLSAAREALPSLG